LQRHIEASGKARKGVAADAESSVARCITTGEMKRQDYETCTMIAQPVPFTKSKRAQSVTDDETWVDGQVNHTLSLFDQGDTRATTVAVGFNWQNGGGYGNANEGLGITVEGTGPLQRCNTPAVAQAMTVRRLTPIECEFLQGFPRNYTLIPWRKKQAEDCPDGPRYKALGNSMAVNCMAWIGERIAKWEAEHER
jgi:site-specific DNA-cytosine methylase